MTSPQAPSPNGDINPGNTPSVGGSEGSVGSAWRGVQGMNRWALLGIVAVILIIVWYFWDRAKNSTANTSDGTGGTSPSSGQNTSGDWETKARQLLTERGYPSSQIDSAMNHYLRGGQMSTQDTALIAVCIRALGTPDIPNPAPTTADQSAAGTPVTDPWNNPGPAVPSGTSQNSSSNALADPVAFIYVTSTGFGWTSSLRGISAQIYGSSNYAATLIQYNPTITSVSDRLPIGTRVKVPRTVNV